MVLALHEMKVIDIAGGFYHTILLVKHKKQGKNSQLSTDMKKIINEHSRADVTFIVEGKPLHAHRCILYVRCKSLEDKIRFFGRKSEEKEKNKWSIAHPNHLVLEIPQVKFKSFLGFIEYLYTDSIRSLKNNQNEELFEVEHLLDLLVLCSEYKLEKLKHICKEAIEPSITVDNCCLILKKVWEVGGESQDELKKTCLDFILMNYQHVISSNVYYELPPQIMKEINMMVVKNGLTIQIGKKSDNNNN